MKTLLKVRGLSYRMAQGMGERPQEAREANVVVEVQDPSQGPQEMMMVEVQLAAVLAEEEEVLAVDDRVSVAERMTTTNDDPNKRTKRTE